jgi:hypothetical protein
MDVTGCNRTGELTGITETEISYVLGRPNPTIKGKGVYTKFVWCFHVKDDNGRDEKCAIWDFFESDKHGEWTTSGPVEVFSFLFGEHHVRKLDNV